MTAKTAISHPVLAGRDFHYEPPQAPLDVLHCDDNLLIIDKPSGLLSVPGKSEDYADCVESRARAGFADARIVHRLDMATSGVMALARNANAHRHLGLQFERRHVKKSYIADVSGIVLGETGRIDLPLICDWPNRPLQMVDFKSGKKARTDWEVLSRHDGFTRLRLHPITGRSHQLRVHMLAIKHPILGDRLYAPDDVFRARPRLALHAECLQIHHPIGGERIKFSAEVPF